MHEPPVHTAKDRPFAGRQDLRSISLSVTANNQVVTHDKMLEKSMWVDRQALVPNSFSLSFSWLCLAGPTSTHAPVLPSEGCGPGIAAHRLLPTWTSYHAMGMLGKRPEGWAFRGGNVDKVDDGCRCSGNCDDGRRNTGAELGGGPALGCPPTGHLGLGWPPVANGGAHRPRSLMAGPGPGPNPKGSRLSHLHLLSRARQLSRGLAVCLSVCLCCLSVPRLEPS